MRQQQTKRSDDMNKDRDWHAMHPQGLHRAIVAVVLENGRVRRARALSSTQLHPVICQISNFEECRSEEERQEQNCERAKNELHVELRDGQAVLPRQQGTAWKEFAF